MILLCFKGDGVQVASLLFPSPSRLGFRVLNSLSSEVDHDISSLLSPQTPHISRQPLTNHGNAILKNQKKKKKKSHIHGELNMLNIVQA